MTLLVVDDDAAMRHLLKGWLEGEGSVALHLGATRYLEKPFRVAELLTAVRMVTKGVKPEPVLDTRVNAPRAVTRRVIVWPSWLAVLDIRPREGRSLREQWGADEEGTMMMLNLLTRNSFSTRS